MGDHQGVARHHQVQQFQEAAAVVLAPLASSALMLPMAQPARTSRSTSGRFR